MMYIIEKCTVIGQIHGWLDCQTFLLINQAKFVKTEFKFFREIIKIFYFLTVIRRFLELHFQGAFVAFEHFVHLMHLNILFI